METGETRTELDSDSVKKEWLRRMESLVEDVKRWAIATGWRTRRIEKTITERGLGTYKVPVLLMEKDTIEIVLNPVARFVPGAQGAVDLYLAPAYDDIASLYYEGDCWVVHHAIRPDSVDSGCIGVTTPQVYSEQTILSILNGMAVNA